MVDLVQQLRDGAKTAHTDSLRVMIGWGAAEIERLKAERDHWEREAHDHAYDDVDEIERLRAALDEAADELDRVAMHAIGTPGLHYDSLESLIGSATCSAKMAAERVRAVLSDQQQTEK